MALSLLMLDDHLTKVIFAPMYPHIVVTYLS